MTTSKVKKMLLTDAAIALSRFRCRPNRGPYSHLVVCVCLSLSLQCAAMVTRRRTTTTASREEKRRRTTRAPQPCRGYGSFRFYGGHTYL